MTFPFISNRPAGLALLAVLALPAWASIAYGQLARYPKLDLQPTAQAANSDTPIPAATYQSVLAGLPKGVEQTSLDWKKANADVGQFKNGYVDLLKWEQAQSAQPAKAPAQDLVLPSGAPRAPQ